MTNERYYHACLPRGTAARSWAPAATRFVDVHCHCLPNLDDGPESLDEALALCRALVADRIDTVVATPHQLGRYERRTGAEKVRTAVHRLNAELAQRGLDLTVLPGGEVRLDERIGALLAQRQVLTLADANRYLLLELPGDTFIDIEPLLGQLALQGLAVLIAHPERNLPLFKHGEALERWLACGAGLQVTAASLTGDFGPPVELAAWRLVRGGWAVAVATDAHDPGANGPRLTEAFQMLMRELGYDMAHLLCIDNPGRIVRGESLVSPRTWQTQEVG
jgi:protein-tyrosine phosphatase